MPTECERSATSPTNTEANAETEIKDHLPTSATFNEELPTQSMMEGDMSTSQTSTTSNGSSSCNGVRKTSITSPDPTAYVAKARVTRPTPPPPPYNPMQFVQIKPCNLYQTAQEQLKKAEEVKKIKEIRKEEPEDWQNNLDNWKSSRRKRVEHIIDRVVEVKKLELEEHDRTRRKSKTFSEMIEERGERSGGRGLNKLASLAVYAEDEANDLSDLGIGTSSASGKSSLSEDYDNNSVMSDNAAELDKAITNSTHKKPATTESTTREYISSPGYETSSSTAPASSPDPCEYTYEGAIQDYKQRVSRAASGLASVALNKLAGTQQAASKESTPERAFNREAAYPPRRGSKIEDRLMGFEVQSPSEECAEKNKVDVPKIDISKRKEIFESAETQHIDIKAQLAGGGGGGGGCNGGIPRVTLKDRFKIQDAIETLTEQPKRDLKRLSGDLTSIKERLQNLEQQQNLVNGANGATKTAANKLVDIPVPPLKERLSSLQNAVTKEEVRKPPVVLVDARQLEIMKSEEEKAQQTLKVVKQEMQLANDAMKVSANAAEKAVTPQCRIEESRPKEVGEIDKDDSGVHTANDVELEERLQADLMKKEQELQLNAAIEALAKEEKQLSEAANAVNQIEAEFEELTLGSVALPPLASNSNASATPITNEHMEYSVSSTNPQTSSTCSNNHYSNLSSNSNSKSSGNGISGNGSGIGSGSNTSTVTGLDFKTASNLRRKPTNEMVHAKNLLKIFKQTFQNDIQLDEQEVNEEHETKTIKGNLNTNSMSYEHVERECRKMLEDAAPKAAVNTSIGPQVSVSNAANTAPTSAHSTLPSSSSMIPRSVAPLGKPPLSPMSIRSTTKFVASTPPASPSLTRRTESQFSINGRVEIFNSKTMSSSPTNSSLLKPLIPTATTKNTQLAYIGAPKISQSNNIVLPNQQKLQQLPQEATTKRQQHTSTVIEPLLTTSAAATARKSQQQQQQQQHVDDEQMKELKSMPSEQMANEPQTHVGEGETYHQLPPAHSSDAVKQQQQPEVVVCAPPITILNPDELPKPNTVKNLSSCFQQRQPNGGESKRLAPKPLPRTRIPQVTQVPSPILPRRHVGNKPEEPSPLSPAEGKPLATISASSSTRTDAIVVAGGKPSSVLSNTSENLAPTWVTTSAQVHREVDDKEMEKVAHKNLEINERHGNKPVENSDKQENIRDFLAEPLDPLSINLVTAQGTPKEAFPQSSVRTSPSNLPFKSPLQPSRSPHPELSEATTSAPYDKYSSSWGINRPLTVVTPAALPNVPDCSPNESTLYKLASSAPHSPSSPTPSSEKCLAIDSAICNSLLTSLAVTPNVLQRQQTVEEDLCQKLEKEALAFHQGSTACKDISKKDIERCEGTTLSSAQHKPQGSTQRPKTVDEEPCHKVDSSSLPDDKQLPATGYKCVSPTEIRKCDSFFALNSGKSAHSNAKPNSPIIQARAAHSKALIETCEKIIAEERVTSSQLMKSSLPIASLGTPLMQRRSKIPKPITSCCKPNESLNEADLDYPPGHSPTKEEKGGGAIARLHVVETQIKVTTSTPPPSPKVVVRPPAASQPPKKTKNIFDFLKKNFGVGGHSNKEEPQETPGEESAVESLHESNILVLSEQELQALESVKSDEVHQFDNSKFYIASNEMNEDDTALPPPLPKTPAPVNIEITRKITTDEILEGDKTETDLTKEIDDLLDDELNKLNLEIQELEKINEALELALAAIDKETIPLQPQPQPQPQQQPPQLQPQPQRENLCPITVPSNKKTDATATINAKNNNNNFKESERETVAVDVVESQPQKNDEQQQQHKNQQLDKVEVAMNKTDEEKCEKLKLEENFTTNRPVKEITEEEISKEPIYENISSTASIILVDVAFTTTATTTTATTTTTSHQQQQEQQQQQFIPSVMSRKQIEQLKTINNDAKPNFNFSNNQTNNRNQTQMKSLQNLSASNQFKNSQINTFSCQINNNNNNNNNIQINQFNNVVDLTNAFANTTTTATEAAAVAATTTTATACSKTSKLNTNTTTATATATATATPAATTTMTTTCADLSITANHNTITQFKEITFNHLEQTSSNSSPAPSKPTPAPLQIQDTTSAKPIDEPKPEAPDHINTGDDTNTEPYYQVPKSNEPYYDAPKHLRPVPVYENIEVFFSGSIAADITGDLSGILQPPKEKPPPPPADSPPLFDDVDSSSHTDTWSSDNTYETLTRHQLNHHNHHLSHEQPSPPIKRMNSTKRIKKELRNKRSSFLGIEGSSLDDDESYLELTVAPPPDMAQLLQEERRLEKQLYLKAGLCDSSDTGESRDSGVSENHSRQSSEHFTNSSEENETHDNSTSPLMLQTQTGLDPAPNDMMYQNDGLLAVVPTPLLQTVKGNSAESWTESATVAAAATQSLSEATATANAKMMSIEEKIREQEEVLRVERELLQLEQEELKRQRENLMLRENMARRELQHGAKMLMSANRRSLQDLNGLAAMTVVNIGSESSVAANSLDVYHQHMHQSSGHAQSIMAQTPLAPAHQQQPQQIYANIPNLQQHQYYHMQNDYRKSMSDINEFSKRIMAQPPAPPSKPLRAIHMNGNGPNCESADYAARQRHSLNSQNFGGSLVKIAPAPTAAPRTTPHIYSNYHHQSVQNLSSATSNASHAVNQSLYPGNMSRNTLHALSATPKPKYTDGWVQVQQRKSYDSNLANDPAWVSAYQQKRKSMPDAYHGYSQNNHWLIQEAEQRRLSEQPQQPAQRRTFSSNSTPVHLAANSKLTNGSAIQRSSSNGKPLPDSIIQTLTERVQSKGIGERKRSNLDKSPSHAASTFHQYQQPYNKLNQQQMASNAAVPRHNNINSTTSACTAASASSTAANASQGQSHNVTTQQQKQPLQQQQDKILSVSGKKKCSHCGDELGRGAAMIIESLLLFYHINCFKCCVCHVQLGDGLNGTDVRVRNHKLHCQNCYSSDDGIKFSCV